MRSFRSMMMLLLASLGMLASAIPQSNSEPSMETIKLLLKKGDVSRVEIFHVPDSMLTRAGLSPEALRSIATTKTIFSTNIGETFNRLFAGTSAERVNRKPDLRWGIVFYDNQNREIASVFVDKFGRYGYLDMDPVAFNAPGASSNLARRLHELIDDSR